VRWAKELTDPRFRGYVLTLVRERTLGEVGDAGHPEEVYTFLRCCLVGIFRKAHREAEPG
jgi:hypothetical protein